MEIRKSSMALVASLIVFGALFLYQTTLIFSQEITAGLGAIIVIYFAVYLIAARRYDTGSIEKNIILLQITAFSILLGFLFFDMMYLFALMIVVSIIFLALKVFGARDFLKIFLVFIVIFIGATFLFQPALSIARGQGTVLSPNWWEGLNWIEENTAECAVIATYWDPGHFITGIARRPVVFDGASQNSPWTTYINSTELTEGEIRSIAVTDRYTSEIVERDGQLVTKIETGRIQDIATTLATENETFAVDILKKFRQPGCDEMYYLATADLIGKSFWWTYFSDWNPVDKGCGMPMTTLQLADQRQSVTGATTLTYTGGVANRCNVQDPAAIVLIEQNNTLNAFMLLNNQLASIETLFYFSEQGGIIRTVQNPDVEGLVFLAPDGRSIVFTPGVIKDSMFARMFLFNGEGLENFEMIQNWGGEVKLFRVNLD